MSLLFGFEVPNRRASCTECKKLYESCDVCGYIMKCVCDQSCHCPIKE